MYLWFTRERLIRNEGTSNMKKQLMLVFALLLALVLVACSDDDTEENSNENNTDTEEQSQPEVEITEEEQAEDDAVVVNVNGSELLGDKYNNIYKQLKTMLHMYGQDTSDVDMLKDETVSILVEQELIRQDAKENGIEVTEEEAQAEIDTIVEENGEEALNAMLEQYELTEEEFLAQLIDDLTTVKYIEDQFEVEVTDEEIEEQYNLLKEQQESEEIGELAEYEELIRQNISEQKQGQLLESRIAELKEDAEIETLI